VQATAQHTFEVQWPLWHWESLAHGLPFPAKLLPMHVLPWHVEPATQSAFVVHMVLQSTPLHLYCPHDMSVPPTQVPLPSQVACAFSLLLEGRSVHAACLHTVLGG
jgi:hypothetical protein